MDINSTEESNDMTLISVKRVTKEVLKRMCESEQCTYTGMINRLIDYWNDTGGDKY